MSLTISKAKSKSDLLYVDKMFPKFFNKDRFPKVKKQADDGAVEIYIAKKTIKGEKKKTKGEDDRRKKVGFVIWHEISNDWIYIDFIAATGYGEEFIKKLHNMWINAGYKGINLDTFIYDGELPRSSSARRLNYFYNMGYQTDVIDYPAPSHVMFHMIHKFGSKVTGGNESEKTSKPIANRTRYL